MKMAKQALIEVKKTLNPKKECNDIRQISQGRELNQLFLRLTSILIIILLTCALINLWGSIHLFTV